MLALPLENQLIRAQLHLSFICSQSVPKPPPMPPSKKRKRVIEEPPVALAPKPMLSGAVALEAFLATLQKVGNVSERAISVL